MEVVDVVADAEVPVGFMEEVDEEGVVVVEEVDEEIDEEVDDVVEVVDAVVEDVATLQEPFWQL